LTDTFDITCRAAVALVPEYLDAVLPEAELVRLEHHMVACPGCLAYVEKVGAVIQAVGGLRRQGAPSDARRRLVAVLAAEVEGP
jgi:predicted anti-sigma-YlaC factor YlaD